MCRPLACYAFIKIKLVPCHLLLHVVCMCQKSSGVIRWETMARPPLPLWSDREFLDTFCTVFVSCVSRLNRKVRVPRLLVTVGVFCQSKSASKCTQTSFWGQKCFSREEPALNHAPSPRRLRRLAPPYWNPKYATAKII